MAKVVVHGNPGTRALGSRSVAIDCAEIAMKKISMALTVAGMVLFTATGTTAFAASSTDQISIRYVPPANPAHQPIYTKMRQRGALEKLQKILSPFRLPEKLRISLEGCDGEADAFYDYAAITICYEFIDELWQGMPSETTLSGIAPFDTVIGPLFEASLHEFGHALFDMLDLPVFGREEDAADQVAAYMLLHFSESEAHRLISGTVHAYGTEARKADGCRVLEDFSHEHSTPAQRAYNLMCIAYGADKKLFGDFVSKGYLPRPRAEYCHEEYEQVQEAFETLVRPHTDLGLGEKVWSESWLCESWDNDASGKCLLLPPK